MMTMTEARRATVTPQPWLSLSPLRIGVPYKTCNQAKRRPASQVVSVVPFHAMPPEYSHTLTRCVGQGKTLRVDNARITIEPGDRLLFCTDGLDKVISSDAIKDALARKQSPEEACHQLTQMANDNEGPDNITVIVILIL